MGFFKRSISCTRKDHPSHIQRSNILVCLPKMTAASPRCAKIQSKYRRNKILDGETSTRFSDPWYAFLKSDATKGAVTCGAFIIHEYWIVTAAHCVYDRDPKNTNFFTFERQYNGCNEGRKREVEDYFWPSGSAEHTLAELKLSKYDIALLKLSRPFRFSSTTLPLCIKSALNSIVRLGSLGRIMGCGQMSSHNTKYSDNILFVKATIVEFMNVSSNALFATKGYRDRQNACTGDSGGPFVIKDKGTDFAAGIVHGNVEDCENGYTFMVNVEEWYSWIVETMLKEGTIYI